VGESDSGEKPAEPRGGQPLPPVAKATPTLARDDNWLLEAFIRREPAAEEELCLQLNRLLYRVYKQRWSGTKVRFRDVRGDCFEVLGRWRDEGSITLEPLPWLANRLMKQCARQQVRAGVKESKLLRLDAASGKDDGAEGARKRARKAELRASKWNPTPTPEDQLLGRELYEWLVAVREKLSPLEQATYDASIKLADGEVESLHEALGIKEDAAWQRRHRMRVGIAAYAYKDGMQRVIDRFKTGRAPRRDKKKEHE
jgi:hypothetical protein